MSENGTDELERAMADALSTTQQTTGYECRDCGLVFNHGRDARQHMMDEHDNPKGIKRLTGGSDG